MKSFCFDGPYTDGTKYFIEQIMDDGSVVIICWYKEYLDIRAFDVLRSSFFCLYCCSGEIYMKNWVSQEILNEY